MLIIREAQLAAFRGEATQRFDRRLLAALVHSFPRDHARLGDAPLRALVALGRRRAARHGWRSEQTVYLHLTLMLMLGAGFDTDPQLPWLQQAMAASAQDDPTPRLFALHATVLDQLDAVLGVHNEHLVKALLRWRTLDLAVFESQDAGDRAALIAGVLAEAYPRKAAVLGEAGLRALAEAAAAKAGQQGLHGARAHGLVAVLMFMLGHQCDTDPALPDLAQALATPGPEPLRVQALHRAALVLLQHGLGSPPEAGHVQPAG
ncbi:MAG: hypothetical protein HY855_05435 [Burkholderiales bacterium]|nr:hypothetical protein [Burkholderiales bacterium]